MKRVLVVDDVPGCVKAVSRPFRRAGYTVLEAADMRQSLRLARTHRPGFAVVDLCLVNETGLSENGLDLIVELQMLVPEIRAVLFSGRVSGAVSRRAKESNVLCFDKVPEEIPRMLDEFERELAPAPELPSRDDWNREWFVRAVKHFGSISAAARAAHLDRATVQRNLARNAVPQRDDGAETPDE